MIVPVVCTAVFLFPFLQYIVFADETLIPLAIRVTLSSIEKNEATRQVNPHIPRTVNVVEDGAMGLDDLLNPFLDRIGALIGTIFLISIVIILLILNAVNLSSGGHPDSLVTMPAASLVFLWDIATGWRHRHENCETYRLGQRGM